MFGKKKAGRATGKSDRAVPKKGAAGIPHGAEDTKEEEIAELAEKLQNLFSAIDGLQRSLGTAPPPEDADEDFGGCEPEDDPEDVFEDDCADDLEDDLEEDFDLDERVPAREKRVSAPKEKRKARPARSAKPKKKEADYSWIEEEEEMMWDDE